jgi:Concanavalin A-like lectin/glucanases superfamily
MWRFRMQASLTDTVNFTLASAPATGVTTAYHHLVGVFDAQRREIRIHVDGVLRATTPMIAQWQPWDATGPLQIGRRQDGDSGADFTQGDVDEVRVFQGVVADVSRIP